MLHVSLCYCVCFSIFVIFFFAIQFGILWIIPSTFVNVAYDCEYKNHRMFPPTWDCFSSNITTLSQPEFVTTQTTVVCFFSPSSYLHHRGTQPVYRRPALHRTRWSHCRQRCKCSPPHPNLVRQNYRLTCIYTTHSLLPVHKRISKNITYPKRKFHRIHYLENCRQ